MMTQLMCKHCGEPIEYEDCNWLHIAPIDGNGYYCSGTEGEIAEPLPEEAAKELASRLLEVEKISRMLDDINREYFKRQREKSININWG